MANRESLIAQGLWNFADDRPTQTVADHQASGTEIFSGITERLLVALDSLTAPHIPSPEEARHLEAALFHLIAAFELRDFAALCSNCTNRYWPPLRSRAGS